MVTDCEQPEFIMSVNRSSTLTHTTCTHSNMAEYELVQNAVFTDPNDQSAWFYHRWLLGKGAYMSIFVILLSSFALLSHTHSSVEKPEALACVYFTRSPSPALYITFNQPVKVHVHVHVIMDITRAHTHTHTHTHTKPLLIIPTCILGVYPSQVSESRPIHVTIGESVIQCSGESNWPGAFYGCSIPSDLVSTSDNETDIKVIFDTLEKSISLKRGWL